MTIYHYISTFIVIFIAIGLWKRHDVKVHVSFMLAAFALDVLLVLIIELTRQAIETVAETIQEPKNHELLLFHVSVSVLTLILYTILTILGFKIMKGQRHLLKLHRNLGGLFLICRLANYITSFYVI